MEHGLLIRHVCHMTRWEKQNYVIYPRQCLKKAGGAEQTTGTNIQLNTTLLEKQQNVTEIRNGDEEVL